MVLIRFAGVVLAFSLDPADVPSKINIMCNRSFFGRVNRSAACSIWVVFGTLFLLPPSMLKL